MSAASRTHAVISTIGPDRSGIVEAISKWILAAEGNIEESRMAVLGGEFATIILVTGGPGLLKTLGAGQGALEHEFGLHVFIRESAPEPEAVRPMLRYELHGTALDQAGIIYQVSQQLSGRGINIVRADTSTEPAPFSGAPVFHFRMEVDIPAGVPIGQVRTALAELGDRENLDLVLQALTD